MIVNFLNKDDLCLRFWHNIFLPLLFPSIGLTGHRESVTFIDRPFVENNKL